MNHRLKRKPLKRYQVGKVLSLFVVVYGFSMLYGMFKPLPENISYESDKHKDTEAEVLFDITHEQDGEVKEDHEIFDRIEKMIADAEDFLVVDMFLFNDEYPPDLSFPPLASWFSEQLVEKKRENPDLSMVVITDRINSFYGSRVPEHIQRLEEAGIQVVWAEMEPLRDSNVIYSGLWRSVIQWFGTPKGGWLPSPFSSEAEPVTVRSYLDMLNFKANHRKVVINEQEALVTSANPHDASAHHSNVALSVRGKVINDILESERAVVEMSDADPSLFDDMEYNGKRSSDAEGAEAKVITEGKVKEQMLKYISAAEADSDIWLGAFYVSDRDIIHALKEAADRGANVRLILDPNHEAFGREKIGVPNRPVADELQSYSDQIEVRWYNTNGEQYHTKMLYMTDGDEAMVNGGSSNFTRRNIDDLNLETNLLLVAPKNHAMMEDIEEYFHALWNNDGSHYTHDFSQHSEGEVWKYWLYRLQETTGLSSF